MNYQVKSNSRGIAPTLSCVLFSGVSLLALGLAMPAAAQDSQSMETIVVTGQRESIENSIKMKENADQIVDTIVADDAGKLPDRSITEVLQRVSGVTITHFNNLGNPDDYTVEGSGPTVRGLPGGTSTLNGHNAFSANGGRQILWGDVPSELMAAVDVFKTYTPDQIEGGLGGTINLRTHMPFDFDGSTVKGLISTSYGDLIKQARPRGSIMASTRWDTKLGEVGFLLDLSYDDNSYRNDAIQVEPYFPHTNVLENYTLETTGSGVTPVLSSDPTTYWMPGGFDYHTNFGYHKRGGVYAAFQWRPSEQLSVHATVFSTANEQDEHGYDYAATSGAHLANITYTLNPTDSTLNTLGTAQLITALSGPAPGPNDPLYHLYDANHNLVYANTYFDTGFIDANSGGGAGWSPWQNSILARCGDPTKLCSTAATRTDASKTFARTTDLNVGANWEPNDRWLVKLAGDFIYSKANRSSLEVEGDVVMPPYGIDLAGNYPRFVISDPEALQASSNYFWNDTMEDRSKNYGQEAQVNLDAEYKLNSGFIKSIKAGVRGDIRTEEDNDTGYNWQGLSPTWQNTQRWWSDPAAKADITLFQFPNFFRGDVNLPGPALFASASKVEMLNAGYFQDKYSDSPQANKPYDPYQAKHYKTVNLAAYAMATFSRDDVLGMAMSGNAGARLVYVDNQANGYWTVYGTNVFEYTSAGPYYATVPMNIPVQGGRVSWTVLPSFNVQFMPTDKIHIRFAGSVTEEQPTFAGIYGSSSVGTEENNHVWTSFNFQGDDPRLKPQLGRNFDMSFEWYGDGGAEMHVSGFYKSIKHKQVSSYQLWNMPWAIGLASTDANGSCNANPCVPVTQLVNEETVVQTRINSDKEAIVRGFEVGFTKYFDFSFVPSYLKGFGFSGNYTYIDSRAPGSYSFDMFGNNISNHMPIEGLSHHSYNAMLMYDRDPLSFRLAYNWRNKYLMSASGWNTQGTYWANENYVSCPQNNDAADGWGGNVIPGQCHYSLPVWSKSFGSLDAGMDYKIDDHFTMSIQSQNLLNTVAKTTMGYGTQEHGRSWFVADRRVSMDIRMNY